MGFDNEFLHSLIRDRAPAGDVIEFIEQQVSGANSGVVSRTDAAIALSESSTHDNYGSELALIWDHLGPFVDGERALSRRNPSPEMVAARNGNWEHFRAYFFRHGFNANHHSGRLGQTVYQYILATGDAELIQQTQRASSAVGHYADANLTDARGRNGLMVLAESPGLTKRALEVVVGHISEQYSNLVDRDQVLADLFMVQDKSSRTIGSALATGWEKRQVNGDGNPNLRAAQLELLEWLLSGLPDAKLASRADAFGEQPALSAVKAGAEHLLDALMEHDAYTLEGANQRGETLLSACAAKGLAGFVARLISKGADPDLHEHYPRYRQPLADALIHNRLAVAKDLIELGADPVVANPERYSQELRETSKTLSRVGLNTLVIAIDRADHELFAAAIAAKHDPNHRSPEDRFPLHDAIYRYRNSPSALAASVKALIRAGADPYLLNQKNHTAVEVCQNLGDATTLDVMLTERNLYKLAKALGSRVGAQEYFEQTIDGTVNEHVFSSIEFSDHHIQGIVERQNLQEQKLELDAIDAQKKDLVSGRKSIGLMGLSVTASSWFYGAIDVSNLAQSISGASTGDIVSLTSAAIITAVTMLSPEQRRKMHAAATHDVGRVADAMKLACVRGEVEVFESLKATAKTFTKLRYWTRADEPELTAPSAERERMAFDENDQDIMGIEAKVRRSLSHDNRHILDGMRSNNGSGVRANANLATSPSGQSGGPR